MALPVLAGAAARFIASHVAKKVAQRAAARQAAKIAAERAAAKPALNLAERGAEIVAKRNAAQQGFQKSQMGKDLDKGIQAFKDDAAKITSSADKRLATAGGAGMLGLLGVVASQEENKKKPRGFDPEGEGYDYPRAKAAGMLRGADGHMGSVAPASEEQRARLGLPQDSYVILKGRAHPTFDLAVAAEEDRGSEVVKRGHRYYSIPRQ